MVKSYAVVANKKVSPSNLPRLTWNFTW